MYKNVCSEVEDKKCCGCGACYNICPVGAIKMQENNEGFLTPIIDENKCTNCGLCLKACPSLNVKYKNNKKPECYAAMANDEIRMKSSSGGMFTLIAEYILDKGGYVCGAAFKEDWSVHHIIIDNKNNLEKLRGSKYVQSDTEKCYSEIKQLLNNDNYVLFSGCPCQVAGLYSYLGKEYKKLYTIDLVCHGAPSRKVWRKYLEENFDIKTIDKIDFRDKKVFGWATTMNLYFKNGTSEYHKDAMNDPYFKGFIPCMISNKHCGECLYTKLPRQGDISLADWWGIDKFKKGLNDNKGTSQVLVNSKKGQEIYNAISSNLKLNDNIGLKTTLKSINKTIYEPFPVHPNRERFFQNIDKLPVVKNIIDSVEDKYDVLMLSTFFAKNFGAIFVAYAVNKLLQDLGYTVLMLQKPTFVWPGYPIENTISIDFAKKHYNITRPYNDNEDLISLNNHCEHFVVGSDQLFNPLVFQEHNFVFLDFVKNNKNKISFATSFGKNKHLVSEDTLTKRKYLLKRFNKIAVREKFGVDLCQDIFNIDAEQVIDPTLMLPVSAYNDLIGNEVVDIDKPYLLTYMLDMKDAKLKAVEYIAKKLNLTVINIANLEEKQKRSSNAKYIENVTPEKFLYLYKNATYIVTDSYHGTCFAIKYNKQFISFINREILRFKMFDEMGLGDRICYNIDHIYEKEPFKKQIDFTEINSYIEEKSRFAINWLKEAMESKNSEKYSPAEDYIDLIQKELACKTEILRIKEANMESEYQKLSLLTRKNEIIRSYYKHKILSKLLRGGGFSGYHKNEAKRLHQKVRRIRQLEKEGV